MLTLDQKRKEITTIVNTLPENQLDIVNELLHKIDLLKKDSIEYLFAEAVAEYGNTLKELAK